MKRMSTMRKDLVHVSELMRDSLSRIQDISPAAALDVPSGSSSSPLRGGTGAGAATATIAAAAHTLAPAALASESNAPSCPPAWNDTSPIGLQQPELAGAAAVASTRPGTPEPGTWAQHSMGSIVADVPVKRPQSGISANGVQLEGLGGRAAAPVSACVAAALSQPIPPGVVRDVKLSRLAGELEPTMPR